VISARDLLLKAGQRIGAAWIAALVRALRSLVVVTGEESQVVTEHTEAGQVLSLSRPIPAYLWGRTTEGAIPARDGSGYWGVNDVTLYNDFIDEDGEPYSELGDAVEDLAEAWNRMAVEVPADKDVILVEISGRLFVVAVLC